MNHSSLKEIKYQIQKNEIGTVLKNSKFYIYYKLWQQKH